MHFTFIFLVEWLQKLCLEREREESQESLLLHTSLFSLIWWWKNLLPLTTNPQPSLLKGRSVLLFAPSSFSLPPSQFVLCFLLSIEKLSSSSLRKATSFGVLLRLDRVKTETLLSGSFPFLVSRVWLETLVTEEKKKLGFYLVLCNFKTWRR